MINEQQVIAFIGRIGSGKTYQMLKRMEREKSNGNSVAIVSFADPFKQFMKKEIGIRKTGFEDEISFPDRYYNPSKNPNYKYQLYDGLHTFLMDSVFYIKDRMDDWDVFRRFDEKFDFIWEQHGQTLISLIDGCYNDSDNYSIYFRKIMQMIGTDFGRAMYPKIWANYLEERIARICSIGAIHTLFVDDVRFWNEHSCVSSLPYTVTIMGVITSDEVRAKRRNMTIEQVLDADKHSSEADIDSMLSTVPDGNRIYND